jgi:16S rRNA (cytosine967-C5)-methyltransferase
LGNLRIGLRSFLRLYTYLVHYSESSLERAFELVDHMQGLLGKREFKQVEGIPDIIPSMSIPFNEITDTQRLAYEYFHPSWYVAHLFNEFGEKTAEKLIKPVKYPSYIRLNTLRGDSGSIDRLFDEGFQLVDEPALPNTYRLLDDQGITETPEYKDGHFIIQDKASILVGDIAHPELGDIVLDVCAAPGVKTSHLAQLMQNTGRILSIDYNKTRLENMEHLMTRLGVTNARLVLADASKPDTLPKIDADLVIIDPPCTATGLFHKVPSSKWRLTPHSIDSMARLQKRILWNASDRLKPGGTLVYSTCSIMVEENEEVVQSLLDRNPEFKLVEAVVRIGDHGLLGMEEAQRLYPHKHSCNGFFIAKLVKNIIYARCE